jgi:hypothetical protein
LKQKVYRSNPNILEAVKIETYNIYVKTEFDIRAKCTLMLLEKPLSGANLI